MDDETREAHDQCLVDSVRARGINHTDYWIWEANAVDRAIGVMRYWLRPPGFQILDLAAKVGRPVGFSASQKEQLEDESIRDALANDTVRAALERFRSVTLAEWKPGGATLQNSLLNLLPYYFPNEFRKFRSSGMFRNDREHPVDVNELV